ncbi:hypothetical protein LSH36_44g11028 [Paralvinella palmiformis]|uniref:Gamma-aminobutyric acid type B receptor subunit 2 n=1 Tax=Paralvinella palmiformis TaxID=53620 RepID=A0AAD9NDF6_9ANNE|nr:hypothetical protein LSH36_44g11028 [Paralvinella palmiformis]
MAIDQSMFASGGQLLGVGSGRRSDPGSGQFYWTSNTKWDVDDLGTNGDDWPNGPEDPEATNITTSTGDPGYGADAFYHFVYCKPQLVMLLGTSMSEVAKTLAEIVGYWNLLLVSYAATSPALSEREKYPTFYRLAPADSSYNAARKTFLQYFNWKAVAALHEDIETFTLAMDDMNKEFDKENITVKASLTFRTTGDDLQDKLKELKDEDARIIIGSFRENTARHVFCQAYHQGMYGQRYVWMLSGSYRKNWWLEGSSDINCTRDQLSEAVNGYFSVSSMNRILGNERSISGYTTEEFLAEYDTMNVTSPRSTYTQLTYDSLWAIALTLRKTMDNWRPSRARGTRHRLEEFDYVTGTRMKNDFLRTMGGLDFIGVSRTGTEPTTVAVIRPDAVPAPDVTENEALPRVSTLYRTRPAIILSCPHAITPSNTVYGSMGSVRGGRQRKVGMFNPENGTLDMNCFDCEAVVWPDDHVPADQFTKVVRLEYIQPEAFYTVSSVACFGIYLAIVFLSFNLHHPPIPHPSFISVADKSIQILIQGVLVYPDSRPSQNRALNAEIRSHVVASVVQTTSDRMIVNISIRLQNKILISGLSFGLICQDLGARYIKLSSPKLNNAAVAGCILVYLAVILLGMDDAILKHEAFPYVCTARAFLLSAGFSLAFGAMFTKTYRVHQIFRGCHSGLVKNKMTRSRAAARSSYIKTPMRAVRSRMAGSARTRFDLLIMPSQDIGSSVKATCPHCHRTTKLEGRG